MCSLLVVFDLKRVGLAIFFSSVVFSPPLLLVELLLGKARALKAFDHIRIICSGMAWCCLWENIYKIQVELSEHVSTIRWGAWTFDFGRLIESLPRVCKRTKQKERTQKRDSHTWKVKNDRPKLEIHFLTQCDHRFPHWLHEIFMRCCYANCGDLIFPMKSYPQRMADVKRCNEVSWDYQIGRWSVVLHIYREWNEHVKWKSNNHSISNFPNARSWLERALVMKN